MSPDLAARRVLMSAYLYYVLDNPVLPDNEYDALANWVAERWHRVAPIRQWQCGSKEQIAATGHHVKVTWATVDAAHRWAGISKACPLQNWSWSPEHLVHYSGLV